MPSGRWYAAHVPFEHEWLPKLAPHLPLPIPLPLGEGVPGHGYPWPWSVNTWIHGRNASIDLIDDLVEFASALARFLNALRSIDAAGAPAPGQHNFFRGGDLSVYDAEARACIEALRGSIDADAATSAWESALAATWDGQPVWVHGDVAAGNLLVDERGRLRAVIDFGQLAAGDPACDVTIAWTLFAGPSRDAFRAMLDLDELTWLRGRGWALWKAMLERRAHRSPRSPEAKRADRLIGEIIQDSHP
jgi:aminoglycoside phosphotransferase (APT) family kinase protein